MQKEEASPYAVARREPPRARRGTADEMHLVAGDGGGFSSVTDTQDHSKVGPGREGDRGRVPSGSASAHFHSFRLDMASIRNPKSQLTESLEIGRAHV